MIYVIGDSHSSIFCGKDHIQPQWGACYTNKQGELKSPVNKFIRDLPQFYSIRSGAHIAYNMWKKTELIDNLIADHTINVNTDYIFFSYGEIDIGVHIGFNADKRKVPYPIIITEIIASYIKFLKYYKAKGYKVGVYSPVASGLYNTAQRGYKTGKIRNIMTREFTRQLKVACDKHNIIFKSIFEKMIDKNDVTRSECLMDSIHASQFCMKYIMEEFKDII